MYFVILTLLLCLLFQSRVIEKYKSGKSGENFLLDLYNNKKKNRDTYFATLIHDLKTPAFAQIRTIKMLLDGNFGTLNPDQYQILKETLSSEKYMADIVTNILTAYKCDCSELKLHKQIFDISDVLNTIYESIKGLAEERNQVIQINYKCSSLYAFGDKLQITRVMTNLISNAIKYGNPCSEIVIDLVNDNRNVTFKVENKAQPIPKEKLKRIFDKFTGGMGHYNSAGTGLGLYLSKRIIKMHGGEIFAKSFDDGTCVFGFILNLPVKRSIKNHVSEKVSQ